MVVGKEERNPDNHGWFQNWLVASMRTLRQPLLPFFSIHFQIKRICILYPTTQTDAVGRAKGGCAVKPRGWLKNRGSSTTRRASFFQTNLCLIDQQLSSLHFPPLQFSSADFFTPSSRFKSLLTADKMDAIADIVDRL